VNAPPTPFDIPGSVKGVGLLGSLVDSGTVPPGCKYWYPANTSHFGVESVCAKATPEIKTIAITADTQVAVRRARVDQFIVIRPPKCDRSQGCLRRRVLLKHRARLVEVTKPWEREILSQVQLKAKRRPANMPGRATKSRSAVSNCDSIVRSFRGLSLVRPRPCRAGAGPRIVGDSTHTPFRPRTQPGARRGLKQERER